MRTEGLASALQGQTLEDTACSIQIILELRAESRDQDKAKKTPVQGQSWISGRIQEMAVGRIWNRRRSLQDCHSRTALPPGFSLIWCLHGRS